MIIKKIGGGGGGYNFTNIDKKIFNKKNKGPFEFTILKCAI